MTGPEHYVEAERLVNGDAQDIAAAQVHATLALAAATAVDATFANGSAAFFPGTYGIVS